MMIVYHFAEELGSSDESGKDWSDLEREAAEEDRERGDDYNDDYTRGKRKGRGGGDHYDSPKKSKHDKHRQVLPVKNIRNFC